MKIRYSMLLLCLLCFLTVSDAIADSREIRFAFQDRIGSVIPIVAVSKGFFEAEGLNVTPLTFSSGPACAEAIYSGAADVGAMGDTTAVITVSRTDRFKIIASHATGEHRHRIMVRKGSAYSSLEDLRSKRLAVKKGTSTYGGLLKALKQGGVKASEIRITDLSPAVMNDALAAGSVDAFVASEPTPSLMEGKVSQELMTLGGLGNEYPIMLLASNELLDKNTDEMVRLMKALKKAENYAAENPEQVIEIMRQETGMPAAAVKRAVQRHEYHLRLDTGIINSLADTALFLKNEGLIVKVPDFDKVCVFSYVE